MLKSAWLSISSFFSWSTASAYLFSKQFFVTKTNVFSFLFFQFLVPTKKNLIRSIKDLAHGSSKKQSSDARRHTEIYLCIETYIRLIKLLCASIIHIYIDLNLSNRKRPSLTSNHFVNLLLVTIYQRTLQFRVHT